MNTHSDYAHLHSAKDFIAHYVTPLESRIWEMVIEAGKVIPTQPLVECIRKWWLDRNTLGL